MPTSITLKLRNKEFNAELTNSDGLLFLSALFTEEENALFESGKFEPALSKFRNRQVRDYELRLANLEGERKKFEQEEINKELAQFIYQRCERFPSFRRALAARTREIFPEMPTEWVFWNSDSSFGFRLESMEMLELVMAIIAATLGNVDSQEIAPAAPKPEVGEKVFMPPSTNFLAQNRTRKRSSSLENE